MVDVSEMARFKPGERTLRLVMGISRSAIQKHIERLKDAQRLRRVGPDKGGHWEVIG